MSVNEVLEAVKGMSSKEREQVRALLDTLPSESGRDSASSLARGGAFS